jgi:TonB family protein
MTGASSSNPFPGGSRAGPQVATPVPPDFIGRYQILEKIGEGGMGSLYLARDPAIDRLVAIKLLRRGLDTAPLRERFAREARAAGRLRHQNIVTIFDVGEHGGDPFIAMEFLAGETLAELIRDGARLSLSRRLKLIEEACDGLAYAHRAGLVHRDVKPANLMVDADGVLKILDFGIVRVDDSGITQAGVLVGTINYMSPEQVMGGTVDHRSDIFAVGLVAYELLSGRQAFPGTMKDGLLNRILNVTVTPLSQLVAGLDSEVVTIVELALKKDPADRYQDLVRMRNELAKARVRIEHAEDQAATDAAAEAGETVLIGDEPTMPGVGSDAATILPLRVDAERALADGNFRAALTIAGRSAAINPRDRTASDVAARAEAALLDRGRQLESSAGASGQFRSQTPSQAAEVLPDSSPAAQTTGRGTQVAVAVAVLASIVAVIAVWPRSGSQQSVQSSATTEQPSAAQQTAPRTTPSPPREIQTTPAAPAPSAASPESAPAANEKPAATEGRADRRVAEPPAREPANARPPTKSDEPRPRTLPPPPSSPPPPPPVEGRLPRASAAPLRVGEDLSPPRPTRIVPPTYPADAIAKRVEGTVMLDLTVGPDGRVSDAKVVRSIPELDAAALAAARQWEFAPVRRGDETVSFVYPGFPVSFTLPETAKPPATLPGTPVPRPNVPAPAPKPPEPPKAQVPPPPDPSDEIRSVLARYKAAWEALDVDALARVRALSSGEAAQVRAMMSNANRYRLDMNVQDITVDPGGRSATVKATSTHTVDMKIGRARPQTVTNVIHLEKRGEGWIITSIQ